jgi:hypothetical protein
MTFPAQSRNISRIYAPAAAHLAQMQALPLAESGTCSITAGENTASVHQHRSGVLSVALANSIAQTLGLWQIGQRVGSTFSIVKTKAFIANKFFHFYHTGLPPIQ